MAVTNVVVAGLGGQGVIKASDILAQVAFRAGLDVKKAEIHGMSQRGGSVSSDVRFGDKVLSPMVPPGEADFLLVLAADQVDVNRRCLKPAGVLLEPATVAPAALPNKKVLNVALLGVLSTYLHLAENLWLDAIKASLPAKVVEMNCHAFLAGRRSVAANK